MTTPPPNADSVLVFVPVGKESTQQLRTTTRHVSNSLVIGLLDNHKHHSDTVLDRLQQRLTEKLPSASFVRMKKPEAGKGAPQAMLDQLAAQCQVVVNGIGD